ncbi:MAG TPA: type IVB secretion system protein IcmH/DotU [Burkholderiales bacterium]|nr:type IVB secretion system protein IcmH/DotU [Burkholderiales bacterium]
MAEEPKQAFDPDATVAQPLKAADLAADPEATVTLPLKAADPEATISQPVPVLDPEATVTGPMAKLEGDPEATDRRPAFDPDATDRRAAFDPESTVRARNAGRVRKNPFAPKSPPETIQANLSSLGGINPLVAMANPVLAGVPQIRKTLKHPDPAALLASLRDQIEALETSAISAEVSDETVATAVYALSALLDESAAATPWGRGWIDNGLLKALRGESDGAEGFFAKLDQISSDPEKNADLLEFFYICIVLGFEGRYRNAEGGKQALDQVRERLYALIVRRRPRPDALSEHWRTPAAQAAADAALKTAERANAARAAAEQAARAAPQKSTEPGRFALARWPRRAIWSAVAGVVGATLVLYMLGLRLTEDETRNATSPRPGNRAELVQASATATAPVAASSAAAALSRSLSGLPVKVVEQGGRIKLALQDDRQFLSGNPLPTAQVRALVQKIAESLDLLPGAIVVVGHADASPPGSRYSSNAELSTARARLVAQMMAKKLSDSKRLSAEGKGDTEPVAPNDTEAGRAKNRRVEIELKPAP